MTKKEKREGEEGIEERQEDRTQCLLSPGASKLSSTDQVSSSPLTHTFFTFTETS